MKKAISKFTYLVFLISLLSGLYTTANAMSSVRSSQPTPTRTVRPTATRTSLPTATKTRLPTATWTSLPTATKTKLPTVTQVVLPTATQVILPTVTPLPNPSLPIKTVQLAWFYKPPADGNLNSLANNYSTFILTRNDEAQRNSLQALGVQAPILQYLLFMEIQNPGSCTLQPWRNQVAELVGDFCNISAQHPDWFMRDTAGFIVPNGSTKTMMDPSNAGWRNFWLERARAIGQEQYGWQGVFLDNVEASLDKRMRSGAMPKDYPDDASYQAAIEDNLRFLYTSYFKPNGRPLYANIIELKDPAVWMRYIQYLDGAMLENFSVGWHDDYISTSAWETQMTLVEQTQYLGKEVILVSQGSQLNTNLQTYALASYFLVNQGKASFRFSNSSTYNQNWFYDNYNVALGAPLGLRYKVGETWIRDFEHGVVSVNPSLNTASINLK